MRVSGNVLNGGAAGSHGAHRFAIIELSLESDVTKRVDVRVAVAMNLARQVVHGELWLSRVWDVVAPNHVVHWRAGIVGSRDFIDGNRH